MTVPTWPARSVGDARLELGECARWVPELGRVTWVDIESGTVFAASPDRLDDPAVLARADGSVGCALTRGDELVLANENRVVRIRGEEERVSRALFPADGVRRFNDGCLDPSGRLIAGTLSRGVDSGTEQLLRIDGDGVEVLRSGVRLSNGVAFHPDGRLFHVDSFARTVSWCGDLDGERRWQTAFTVDDPSGGLPDGLHIDAGGALWLCVWGAGEVRRYSEHGVLLGRVVVPAPRVTSCALIGTDADVLVITTAREGMDDRALARSPGSGAMFVADVG
ncbi:SMP-30/gluconolactonase/LRE family protein [Galbitalea sp. SE-J8]|uniref:SMP-30/gluconolactonase/LRE family protein n=1 Tax=Galbitalea sp. SE-J8 TaxID=3054952 RepID=UPI00259C9794|nr:SMP-30/gluconolactonase/LRE family protein [Galbitalea sp. SE-J8]MDM4761992.1 SMP-30/gluconolactonase/LRE family protein [Galbitalea sp. SE-J8]